jgi:hypothetical protein
MDVGNDRFRRGGLRFLSDTDVQELCMKYLVTITWADGSVTRATVNKESLRNFSMKACKGASIKWVKQS